MLVLLEHPLKGDGESGVGEEEDGEDDVDDNGGEDEEHVPDVEEGGDGAVNKAESFCLLLS